jgi:hypothetical protein
LCTSFSPPTPLALGEYKGIGLWADGPLEAALACGAPWDRVSEGALPRGVASPSLLPSRTWSLGEGFGRRGFISMGEALGGRGTRETRVVPCQEP